MALQIPFPANPFLSHLSALPPGVFPRALRISGIPAPHWVGELMLSIACSLFFALGSLFGACVVCFQRLTASFAKNRGVGGGVVNLPKLALPSMRGLGADVAINLDRDVLIGRAGVW